MVGWGGGGRGCGGGFALRSQSIFATVNLKKKVLQAQIIFFFINDKGPFFRKA